MNDWVRIKLCVADNCAEVPLGEFRGPSLGWYVAVGAGVGLLAWLVFGRPK